MGETRSLLILRLLSVVLLELARDAVAYAPIPPIFRSWLPVAPEHSFLSHDNPRLHLHPEALHIFPSHDNPWWPSPPEALHKFLYARQSVEACAPGGLLSSVALVSQS